MLCEKGQMLITGISSIRSDWIDMSAGIGMPGGRKEDSETRASRKRGHCLFLLMGMNIDIPSLLCDTNRAAQERKEF